MDDKSNPETLILAAGGNRHLVTLGFLARLEEEDFLDSVNTILCCSSGAIIALLWASGYTFRQIISFFLEIDFINDAVDFDLRSLISHMSMAFTEELRQSLSEMVLVKFGWLPTLDNLHRATGISLKVLTLEYPERNPRLLCKETDPSLSCLDAIMYSCNLPSLYHKMYHRDVQLVDGSLASPYPLRYVDSEKPFLGFFLEQLPEEQQANFINYHADLISTNAAMRYRDEIHHRLRVGNVHFLTKRITNLSDKAKALIQGYDRAIIWRAQV